MRTGRRIAPATARLETKFNPWHDPDDGRFTFAGQGRHFPGRRGQVHSSGNSQFGANQTGSGRTSQAADPRIYGHTGRNDPKNPRNYSIYLVKRGDTLTKIAGLRRGLTAADLAWLNELSSDELQSRQQIKLPHQQFLDEGKRAKDTVLALAHYMDATGGKLPPNVARPPSLATQVEAAGLREIRANGYRYDVDVLLRTRHVSGEIRLKTEPRSRRAQFNAGRPDRRGTDDGGHFIAARFSGPREWFNHFAQDASFNRGAYRALEGTWASAVRSGKRVFVDVTPHYQGTSTRPYKLSVIWVVDGKEHVQAFPNEPRGK